MITILITLSLVLIAATLIFIVLILKIHSKELKKISTNTGVRFDSPEDARKYMNGGK